MRRSAFAAPGARPHATSKSGRSIRQYRRSFFLCQLPVRVAASSGPAGLVEPRADLLGESKMSVLNLDIIMKNTQNMPWVKFPHDRHTKWLDCANCHPAIFIPKQGANPITMNKVLRGEYCGVCHDKVAFALFTCERCHSVPHEGSGPKWW